MPPHLGEGMCSGFATPRRSPGGSSSCCEAAPATAARFVHVRAAATRPALVDQSLAMGKVSCERDPVAAARRDRALRAAGGVEPWPFPALGPGLGHPDEGISPSLVGQLSVQGSVESAGRSGRFDDVVGRGVLLIIDDGSGGSLRRYARGVRGDRRTDCGARRETSRTPTAPSPRWLRAHGAAAVLVRPDFYVFGAVTRVPTFRRSSTTCSPRCMPRRDRPADNSRDRGEPCPPLMRRSRSPRDPSSRDQVRAVSPQQLLHHAARGDEGVVRDRAGMTPTFEFPMGAWLTNDRANHRIALTAIPHLSEDPDKRNHAGCTTRRSSSPRLTISMRRTSGCATRASCRVPASTTG